MVVGHYTLHLQDAGKLLHVTHICMYVRLRLRCKVLYVTCMLFTHTGWESMLYWNSGGPLQTHVRCFKCVCLYTCTPCYREFMLL